MEIDSMPVEIDDIERRTRQLTIEREALKKEKDKASKERLAKLEEELAPPFLMLCPLPNIFKVGYGRRVGAGRYRMFDPFPQRQTFIDRAYGDYQVIAAFFAFDQQPLGHLL